MPEPLQLTVDGREEPAHAPRSGEACEVVRLFDAPQTIRGQLALEPEEVVPRN